MSHIKIWQLQPTGADLFQDPESFLQELSDQEMGIVGGCGLVELIPTFLIASSIASIPHHELNVHSKVTFSVAVSLVTASMVPSIHRK